jgi:hypothetical protein
LIIVGILVVPFNIHLNLTNTGFNVKGNFKLTWIKIKLIQREVTQNKETQKEESKKKNEFNIKNIFKIISLSIESWPYLKRVLSAILKSTSIQKFSLNLNVGLGDAVDTARITGYLWALASLINVKPNVYLSIQPDFQKEHLDAKLILNIRIRLLMIIIELVRAFTKKPVRKLFNELRKMR